MHLITDYTVLAISDRWLSIAGIEPAVLTLGYVNPTNISIRWRDPENTDIGHYIVYITPRGGRRGTEYTIEQ